MIRLLIGLVGLMFASGLMATTTSDDPIKTPAPHTVALTFDDGPSPIYTPQILAILKKYNI